MTTGDKFEGHILTKLDDLDMCLCVCVYFRHDCGSLEWNNAHNIKL